MKPFGAIGTTTLVLLLGIPTLAEALQERQDKQEEKARPEKQEQQAKPERKRQDKPAKQQQQQATGHRDQQHRQQQDKAARQGQLQQDRSFRAPQRTQPARAWQHAQPEIRLSARGDGRIPDDRFRSNFGREHFFRIGNPVLVGGYSRFQHGGYWFGFAEPWPSDWYYTDDVYVDYVDGYYYMYNPYYPGARFAVTVVL